MSILKGQMETHEGDVLYPKTSFDMIEGVPNLASPNLLINSDFISGIINQRGQTSYVGVTNKITYVIDNWFIGRNLSEITVNDDFISVKFQNSGAIGQFIDYEISGYMTLSIKLKDENVKVFTLTNYSNVDGNLKYVFGNVLNDISIQVNKYSDNEKWQLMILNNSTSIKTLNIEFIKLEKGSTFTGMPLWNEADELKKCLMYYNKFFACTYGFYNNGKIYVTIPYLEKMVKKPTVIIHSEYINVISNGKYLRDNNFTVENYIVDNRNSIQIVFACTLNFSNYENVYFEVDMSLDSNDY